MTTLITDTDLAFMRDSIAEAFPSTCTILSEALAADGQGGQTSTWGTVTQNVSCRLDETGATGKNDLVPAGAGLREAHRYTLSLSHASTIGPHDRVEIGSDTYTVISVNADVSWKAVTRAVLELI